MKAGSITHGVISSPGEETGARSTRPIETTIVLSVLVVRAAPHCSTLFLVGALIPQALLSPSAPCSSSFGQPAGLKHAIPTSTELDRRIKRQHQPLTPVHSNACQRSPIHTAPSSAPHNQPPHGRGHFLDRSSYHHPSIPGPDPANPCRLHICSASHGHSLSLPPGWYGPCTAHKIATQPTDMVEKFGLHVLKISHDARSSQFPYLRRVTERI